MNDENIKNTIYSILECDPEEFYRKYRKYKKAEEEFLKLYDPFKEKLIKLYDTKIEIPNSIIIEGMKLTYVAPSVRTSIDSKKLKEEEPEIAKKFTKTTNVSASIRIEKPKEN